MNAGRGSGAGRSGGAARGEGAGRGRPNRTGGTGGTKGRGSSSGTGSGARGSARSSGARRGSATGGPYRSAAARSAPRPATAPQPPQTPTIDVHDPAGVRLQKLLASAGVGSRRACELLITQGRVEVDGQVVTELGVRVDPVSQHVKVDGERVQLDSSRRYYAFNKPVGVVSTMDDELGRPCIGDYVVRREERLFHVGRLDAETDGLLLLTNDGELANRLAHPSYGVLKTYIATVPGPVGRDVGKALRAGIMLEDGMVKIDSFRLVDSAPGKAIVEVVLHEGRKHIVRRLLDAVGHPVETLTRVQVGPVRLADLKEGRMRPLNGREVAALYSAARL